MRLKIVTIVIAMSFFSRLPGSPGADIRKAKIEQHEAQTASPESLDRQAKSEQFLRSEGVPINPHLPAIQDSKSSKIRSPKEVAERLVACTVSAIAGETGDRALIDRVLIKLDARSLLSKKERDFVDGGLQDQQQRIQFSWRYERCWVLLWAFGYVDRLSYPPTVCDMQKLVGLMQSKTVDDILKNAHPRSQKEILDEADLIYRLDWAVVEERVNKRIVVPDEVEKGVVLERHAALNWLISSLDLTTDT